MDDIRKQETIKTYSRTVDEYTRNVAGLHRKMESAFFISSLPKKAKILDLGCGSGRDSKVFFENGLDVTGIDLSKGMIEGAQSLVPNVHFLVMDIENLDFEENSFDGVWAEASLLHVGKKKLLFVVQQISKILKNDGLFYVSVKEGHGEHFEEDTRYTNAKKFWSYFSKEEIELILKTGGFEIIKSYILKPKDSYETHPWIILFCKNKKS